MTGLLGENTAPCHSSLRERGGKDPFLEGPAPPETGETSLSRSRRKEKKKSARCPAQDEGKRGKRQPAAVDEKGKRGPGRAPIKEKGAISSHLSSLSENEQKRKKQQRLLGKYGRGEGGPPSSLADIGGKIKLGKIKRRGLGRKKVRRTLKKGEALGFHLSGKCTLFGGDARDLGRERERERELDRGKKGRVLPHLNGKRGGGGGKE